MCWEIRQHYLSTQAPGHFVLKGEGDWSGVAGGCWSPPVLLSRVLAPMSLFPVHSQYFMSWVSKCQMPSQVTPWAGACGVVPLWL